MKARVYSLIVGTFVVAVSPAVADVPDWVPSDPLKETVFEETREPAPGLTYIHRRTADPMDIHVLIVDLDQIEIRSVLGRDTVRGTETVRSMADRHGALAAVNGDYWGPLGQPQGLTIVDGEIVMAPKHRTAFAIDRDRTAHIGIWSAGWTWGAQAIAPDDSQHHIVMMNTNCEPGWLALYTPPFGTTSRTDLEPPLTELIVNQEHRVIAIREDEPGAPIPSGGFVLTGRDGAGEWLREKFSVGDFVRIDLQTDRDWRDLEQAIGAGPRVLADGAFFQDPIEEFPAGEEFTLPWKRSHYLERQPRTGVGVTEDGRTVILIAVDGRQPEHSLGIYQREYADLFAEFGAVDAMDLDSGGSTTIVLEGEVLNKPSDGRERAVSNALLLFPREQ